jgi:hypothetical protein
MGESMGIDFHDIQFRCDREFKIKLDQFGGFIIWKNQIMLAMYYIITPTMLILAAIAILIMLAVAIAIIWFIDRNS